MEIRIDFFKKRNNDNYCEQIQIDFTNWYDSLFEPDEQLTLSDLELNPLNFPRNHIKSILKSHYPLPSYSDLNLKVKKPSEGSQQH